MPEAPSNPPYFEILFARLAAGDTLTTAAFGRHVHWGFWSEPPQVACTPEEYGVAAERMCREVCDQAGIESGQRVLDVGCGFGGTIASLNERFSNLKLVGVNIDPRQLERATREVPPVHGNTIELVEADAAKIPLEGASFDVVLAVECVFHFNRPGFFAEASRLLRPGGRLTLSDFVPDERAVAFLGDLNLSADEAIRWSYGQIDLNYSVGRYQQLAEANGLALTVTTDITPSTLPTYDFLRASSEDWPDSSARDMFRRATGLLEKASRKRLLGYKMLTFEKNCS